MKALVTGGTGYIGAHTVTELLRRGDQVIIVDDPTARSGRAFDGVEVVHVDLASDQAPSVVEAVMRENDVDAVIHFAARKQVGESVERPAWYLQQNVGGLANLLMAMEGAGVDKLVFSSSAAVYGEAHGSIDEHHATEPVNPYGLSKLVGEQLITAASRAWGLRAASLRYFNVGGAGSARLADAKSLNLIPLVFDRIAAGQAPLIFGDDYDTHDGTCVRDYVHVTDVAEAHLAVLDSLPSEPGNLVLNIGTGLGTSVREMIEAIAVASGSRIEPVVEQRRPGDPAAVVAVVSRMQELTGWRARFGLPEIVESAWLARSDSPATSPAAD